MSRIKTEQDYWNKAAEDPDVEEKYICDFELMPFKLALSTLQGNVLEIGCGIGRLMQPGFYGIDISEKMIDIAKQRVPGAILKVCDGRTIPFEDNLFDRVYCILVFQHLPLEGIEAYIKETSRVMKIGGQFLFQFIQGNEDEPFSHHFPMKTIVELLFKYGFEINTIVQPYIHESWTWITANK